MYFVYARPAVLCWSSGYGIDDSTPSFDLTGFIYPYTEYPVYYSTPICMLHIIWPTEPTRILYKFYKRLDPVLRTDDCAGQDMLEVWIHCKTGQTHARRLRAATTILFSSHRLALWTLILSDVSSILPLFPPGNPSPLQRRSLYFTFDNICTWTIAAHSKQSPVSGQRTQILYLVANSTMCIICLSKVLQIGAF